MKNEIIEQLIRDSIGGQSSDIAEMKVKVNTILTQQHDWILEVKDMKKKTQITSDAVLVLQTQKRSAIYVMTAGVSAVVSTVLLGLGIWLDSLFNR
jgi:hypothetical protein